jgi:hypothetical protein
MAEKEQKAKKVECIVASPFNMGGRMLQVGQKIDVEESRVDEFAHYGYIKNKKAGEASTK